MLESSPFNNRCPLNTKLTEGHNITNEGQVFGFMPSRKEETKQKIMERVVTHTLSSIVIDTVFFGLKNTEQSSEARA